MKTNEYDNRIAHYRKWIKNVPVWYEVSESLCKKQVENADVSCVETDLFVLAPILCDYVLWILSTAMRTGKGKVYFLARDGYQMYHIAKIFCDRLNLPIVCVYLYCSRYALRTAEFAVSEEKVLDYLCLDSLSVTLETVFRRAGITDRKEQEKFAKLLDGMEYFPKRENVNANQFHYTELQQLKHALSACPAFMERLKELSENAYENVIGYFRQEGLLDDEPYLLADSGWAGTMQQSFANLLKSAGRAKSIEGCYFGLYECPAEAEQSGYHTYYFAPESGLSRKVRFNNNVFECICTSMEGMCIGYERMEEKSGACRYVPKLSARENPNKAMVERLLENFGNYARQLAEQFPNEIKALVYKENKRYQKTVEKLLSLFMGNPTTLEAKVYGNYVFCDDVIGEEDQRLAAVLSREERKENRLLPQIMKKYRKRMTGQEHKAKSSAWPEASIVLAVQKERDGAGKKSARFKRAVCEKELWHCRNVKYVRYARQQLMKRKAKTMEMRHGN